MTFTVDTHHHPRPRRDDIEASPELTDSERTAVLGATAMTLIPRLARLAAHGERLSLGAGDPGSGAS